VLRSPDRRRPGALTPLGLQASRPLRLEFTAAAFEARAAPPVVVVPPATVVPPPHPAARQPRRGAPVAVLAVCVAAAAAIVVPALGHELLAVGHSSGSAHRAATSPQVLRQAPALEQAPSLARTPAAAANRQPKDVYPFRPHGHQRSPTAADALPSFYADGLRCSVACRPIGAISGWPLRPFHRQHALRAGLNELRDQSLHKGLDIQARDGARVYAMQPGRAHILQAVGADSRVEVGNFIYWHVIPRVREGALVRPYRTVVGVLKPHAFGHLHLSEVDAAGAYLNPLRPGGRVLSPWTDAERPVIGRPRFRPDGTVLVKAFDPQSFFLRTTYETPVLAPAGLAYRVFDRRGRPVTTLHWGLRGTHLLPYGLTKQIYAPDARQPGFSCFATRTICKPNWDYNLAGGLAPRLTSLFLPAGSYRLSVYAWDWAGNVTARDADFTVSSPVLQQHLRRALSLTVVRG
jgi:hypothetical protein